MNQSGEITKPILNVDGNRQTYSNGSNYSDLNIIDSSSIRDSISIFSCANCSFQSNFKINAIQLCKGNFFLFLFYFHFLFI